MNSTLLAMLLSISLENNRSQNAADAAKYQQSEIYCQLPIKTNGAQ
jgi:hypothetical protein